MNENIFIRLRHREEFDQLTLKEMDDRLKAGIWHGEMRTHALAYVAEKRAGKEHRYKTWTFYLKIFLAVISAGGLIVAALGLLKK